MAKCVRCYLPIKSVQKLSRYQCSSLLCINSSSLLSGQPDQRFKTWSSETISFKNKLQSSLVNQWNGIYAQYEEFVGLKDVQLAQQDVKQVSWF